jgi:DNA polymerase elongation subunit (family B)
MASNFYTNIFVAGSKVYLRGYSKSGKRIQKEICYTPSFYVEDKNSDEPYKDLFDKKLRKIRFDTIKDAREFVKFNQDVSDIYGLNNYVYQFTNEVWKDEIEYDKSLIRIGYLDIENKYYEGDRIDAQDPKGEINLITISVNGISYTFGTTNVKDRTDTNYIYCESEHILLNKFVKLWQELDIDILVSYNGVSYDIPYIIGRIKKVLGNQSVKKLSPYKRVYEIEKEGPKRKYIEYDIKGISIIDFYLIYKEKKFQLGSGFSSFTLDNVAFQELGIKKISYKDEGYRSLKDLYTRNFDLFITYNVRDVDLLVKLENKKKIVDMIIGTAYYAKCNFEDVMHVTRIWNSICYGYLLNKNILPKIPDYGDSSFYEGGYVRESKIGLHKNVCSWDVDSQYPHSIMSVNIGPETIVEGEVLTQRVEQFMSPDFSLPSDFKYSVAGNGCLFRKDKKSFLATLLEELYERRKILKSEIKNKKKTINLIKNTISERQKKSS